ncbi:MAG TPA: hypothetical protein VFS84_12285 [Candidatus Binatia bacterium]|nr:hypothetical protein [Candidatus Binatia bacterium]
MEITWNLSQHSEQTNAVRGGADYSAYSLRELFKLRYWSDADRERHGENRLEAEIRKRCAHIHERTNQRKSAVDDSAHCYRPYGLIFGVVFIVLSSGPFVAVKFLDALGIMTDVNGDYALLTGLWAVLTLPFASMIYLIGGMMDAERVVKWFNL